MATDSGVGDGQGTQTDSQNRRHLSQPRRAFLPRLEQKESQVLRTSSAAEIRYWSTQPDRRTGPRLQAQDKQDLVKAPVEARKRSYRRLVGEPQVMQLLCRFCSRTEQRLDT